MLPNVPVALFNLLSKRYLIWIGIGVPFHQLLVWYILTPASTHTAHVVNPYTKARGKYLMALQRSPSQVFASPLFRRFVGDKGSGTAEANASMVSNGWQRHAEVIQRLLEKVTGSLWELLVT